MGRLVTVDAAMREATDLTDRPGLPFDGDERARLGRRRLHVQVAVDTEHHLIVAHDVIKIGIEIGVDIDKDVFHFVGFDHPGQVAFRRKIKRLSLGETFRTFRRAQVRTVPYHQRTRILESK